MSVIWAKVWFDLWHNKVRTLLAVLSIAAGVFTVGAMFGMSDMMLSSMDKAHQSVAPPHIQMFLTTRINQDVAESIRQLDGIEDVELNNFVSVLYRVRPDAPWKPAILNLKEDYDHQKYELIQVREGRWPGKDDVGIERLASQYLKVGVGDSVTFKIGKTERTLPISGLIRHPFVPPPSSGAAPYFFASAEGLERFSVPRGQYDKLLIGVRPYSLEHAKEVASTIKDHLAKQNIGVGLTMFQDPNKHWGRSFVEGMTVVLRVMAVVALLASVVLILNTLTALITQQTDQIGILKAIGGKSRTIMEVYLTGVLIYGLLALFISLPLGMFVAFGMTQWILNMFNIDVTTFRFSTQAVILSAISALIVPLLAALWPVLSGAAITVRQAIASYGLGSDYGSSWVDRTVEKIGGRLLPSHYATALGNLFRRKARLVLTQLVLVTAGVMFLMVMSLSSSITATLNAEFDRRNYDAEIDFESIQRSDRAIAMAQSVDEVERANVITRYPVTILKEGQRTQEAGMGAYVYGYPTDILVYKPLIVEGRWIQPGDDRAIVIGSDLAKRNKIGLGETVTLNMGEIGKSDWQVIGLYHQVSGGDFSADYLYAPQDALSQATKKYNQGEQMFVRFKPGVDPQAAVIKVQDQLAEDDIKVDYGASTQNVMTRLKSIFEGHGIRVSSMLTQAEERKFADSQYAALLGMIMALAIIVAIVGGIGLMGALSISVVERTKEIGVLRAVGARSLTIMGMFVMEGILQGVFSWLVSVPISFVLGQYLAQALGQAMFSANLDYAYNYAAVLNWLVVILIISTLASLLPARSATRVSVRASLAYT
jgi:putative ABC transport system permease protein